MCFCRRFCFIIRQSDRIFACLYIEQVFPGAMPVFGLLPPLWPAAAGRTSPAAWRERAQDRAVNVPKR
ncbi:hypothetical protein DPQ22_01780 [Candidatus Tokpelaia sp.]|nr:hypothetical protein DPQ22_01780 [Candidatus Tokpelaia sp.]